LEFEIREKERRVQQLEEKVKRLSESETAIGTEKRKTDESLTAALQRARELGAELQSVPVKLMKRIPNVVLAINLVIFEVSLMMFFLGVLYSLKPKRILLWLEERGSLKLFFTAVLKYGVFLLCMHGMFFNVPSVIRLSVLSIQWITLQAH
jgi:hypothetical protein